MLGVRLDFWEEERAETPTLEDELREANRVIEQQARELTLLRQVLREGRDGSFLLQQHVQALLLQDNLDSCQGQGLREHLAEGRRLAEHLVHTLSPENHEKQEEEKEEEPPAPRLSGEEEEVNPTQQTSLREQHVTVRSGQDLSESRRPSHSAALLPDAGDVCACPGTAKNYADEEDKEDLESLASSLTTVPSELQEDAGTEGGSQALTEQDFPPGGADLSECQEPIRSAASLSAKHEVGSVLDGAAPTQEACPQGPWSGDLSPCVSQVRAADTQLQPSTLVSDCLRLPPDQQWGRGCGFATWSLPCEPWILAASADSGPRWLILPVPGFPGAQPRLPRLAQAVCPLLAGPSALKLRKSKRKLLLSKWRVVCCFPGLRLRVQRYQVLLEL
ncbi:neuroblastoma breakpoint family member 4-like [Eulemur rufifrons]|uniref:neuroblastoma breakpoint family member 4-like n=1 Tax=Eulemur rufifrons TaxID=859984 RepID=UPI003742749B